MRIPFSTLSTSLLETRVSGSTWASMASRVRIRARPRGGRDGPVAAVPGSAGTRRRGAARGLAAGPRRLAARGRGAPRRAVRRRPAGGCRRTASHPRGRAGRAVCSDTSLNQCCSSSRMASMARSVPASASFSLIVASFIASLTQRLEADGAARRLVEHRLPGLDQRRLQQHLEGVLQVEQDLGHPAVVARRVECLGRGDERRQRLALKHACLLPELHCPTSAEIPARHRRPGIPDFTAGEALLAEASLIQPACPGAYGTKPRWPPAARGIATFRLAQARERGWCRGWRWPSTGRRWRSRCRTGGTRRMSPPVASASLRARAWRMLPHLPKSAMAWDGRPAIRIRHIFTASEPH